MFCKEWSKLQINCDKLFIDLRKETYNDFDFENIDVKLIVLNVKEIIGVNKYDSFSSEGIFEPEIENIEYTIIDETTYFIVKLFKFTKLIDSLEAIILNPNLMIDREFFDDLTSDERKGKSDIIIEQFEFEELEELSIDYDKECNKIDNSLINQINEILPLNKNNALKSNIKDFETVLEVPPPIIENHMARNPHTFLNPSLKSTEIPNMSNQSSSKSPGMMNQNPILPSISTNHRFPVTSNPSQVSPQEFNTPPNLILNKTPQTSTKTANSNDIAQKESNISNKITLSSYPILNSPSIILNTNQAASKLLFLL